MVFMGCTPETAKWTPAESPKKNKVERVVLTYVVSYPAGTNAIAVVEKKKLQQFLRDNVARPSAVLITLYEYGENSEKRIKEIKRELIKHGVSHKFIIVDYNRKGERCQNSPTEIEIVVEKYLVIPPACSDFSQQIGDAKQGYNSSNYRCAVETNLGMMVANPLDLIQGRPQDPAVGSVMSAAVTRYLEGRITPLLSSSTTTSASSTSSSSGGAAAAPAGGSGAITGTQ